MAEDDQECLQKLKSMREEVNWENEDERHEFLCQLEDLVSDWKGQLPDLREIFHPCDIDWLLAETVKKFDNKSSCWSRNENLVGFVIDTGYRDEPDVDEDGKPLLRRVTAVHHAARKQLYDHLRYYLFHVYDRFDVNYTDDSGLTHFHVACGYGCDDVAKKFLELGQDPNLVWQETGDSPLHLAMKYYRYNIVVLLLRSGADLSLANRNGETPLHLALKHRYDEIAKSILRSGTDLSLATNDGLTPLHFICSHYYYKNSELLEMFFKINDESNQLVRVNARDNKGNTALHLAVRHSNEEVVKFLLRRDANPNLANAEGLTPMHIICQRHHDKGFVEILFDLTNDKYRPLQVDVWDKYGKTPLHRALEQGNKDIAQLLMRYGVDSNLANADGLTPLQIMCKNYCNDDLAEIFLKTCDDIQQTVQVDVVDKLGRTPLQSAVASLMPNTVDSLLSYGADLSSFVFPTKDYFGERIEPRFYDINIKLRLASRALAVCESLEKKGYELDQSNALIMVIKLLTENRVFDKSADFPGFWHGDEEFARDAREQPVCRSLSLYDVIQWSLEEALKRIKYKDYFEFSSYHWIIPKKNWEACELHLCEMMSRGFLRGWATVYFMELTRCKLPFDCCKMIVEHLINKDLCNICLAASGQSS